MHVIFERPKAIHHVLRVGRNERGGVQRATLRPDPILFGTKLTGSEAARPVAGKERAVSVPQKLEIKRIASLLQGFDGGKDRADVVERIDRFLTAVLLQVGGEHFVERHPRTFNSR